MLVARSECGGPLSRVPQRVLEKARERATSTRSWRGHDRGGAGG